jgi:predicted Zn-dependent protease
MGKRLFPKLYGLLSLLIALSIAFSSPVASQNRSLGDLLQRGVQVIQLSTLSDAQEVQFGKQINQEIVSSERFTLATNPALKAYINKIGQRLAQVSDRPQIPYTFQVIADDNINAFAIMGGFVWLLRGLFHGR